ncbi:MAG: RNA polymerase sigma factor [Deltaproteobacteria bacterium]
MEDRELLEAWRGGDRSAGNQLFERHFDAVYRFFSGKVGGEAADHVQRCFLALVEGRDRFRGDASVRTFLFAIARHELYQYWRTRRRDGRLDFGVSSLADLNPSPSSHVRRVEAHARLHQALASIPLDLQIVLELHYWEDQTGPQLAEILQVPEGTVRSRLRRGLEALRAHLTPQNDDELLDLGHLLQRARPASSAAQ